MRKRGLIFSYSRNQIVAIHRAAMSDDKKLIWKNGSKRCCRNSGPTCAAGMGRGSTLPFMASLLAVPGGTVEPISAASNSAT